MNFIEEEKLIMEEFEKFSNLIDMYKNENIELNEIEMVKLSISTIGIVLGSCNGKVEKEELEVIKEAIKLGNEAIYSIMN